MAAERLRVLFIAHAYPRYLGDPVGSFIHNLAVALRDEGIDVVVVAPGAPGVPAHDVLDGIPIHRFRYAPRSRETLAYTGTMSAQARGLVGKGVLAAFVLADLIAPARIRRRERIDVVHAHWWFPGGLVARLLHARSRVPYLVTLHGSDIRLALASAVRQAPLSRRRGQSAVVTAVSGGSRAARARWHLMPRCVVAPMPVLTELFFPGGARDPRRLLFIGKLSAQKGLDRLLRAMHAMREPVQLTVVGAGRVDDAHLRDLARTLQLDDRIEWLPLLSQTELAEQYRRAAVHVIPALDEGLGLTAVESLLSETPVVGFDSGGLPDVVLHERTGLLVPPADEAALAAALDLLVGDPARRAEMGTAGREHALLTFGARAVARRYAALYREVGHL